MSIDTVFYIVGLVLMAGALVVSFVGLKAKDFPGRGALFGILTVFLALVIATCGLAVAVARKEQDERRHEQAEAAKLAEQSDESSASEGTEAGSDDDATTAEQGDDQAAPEGAGGTLKLKADETQLLYDKTELEVPAGEVTIDLDNPSAIPHDVAVRDSAGEQIAATEIVTQATTSLTTTLIAGDYEFFCTVPGQEQAGMVGKLTVTD